MGRRIWLGLACSGLLLLTTGAVTKEVAWRGSGGWGAGMPYSALYEGAREIRLSGEVVRIERVVPLAGMAEGYALILRIRDQLQTVHLGPVWFLERQDYSVETHENVTVVGAQIQLEGQQVLMAKTLLKSGRALQLRDDAGLPVWSSWRRAQ